MNKIVRVLAGSLAAASLATSFGSCDRASGGRDSAPGGSDGTALSMALGDSLNTNLQAASAGSGDILESGSSLDLSTGEISAIVDATVEGVQTSAVGSSSDLTEVGPVFNRVAAQQLSGALSLYRRPSGPGASAKLAVRRDFSSGEKTKFMRIVVATCMRAWEVFPVQGAGVGYVADMAETGILGLGDMGLTADEVPAAAQDVAKSVIGNILPTGIADVIAAVKSATAGAFAGFSGLADVLDGFSFGKPHIQSWTAGALAGSSVLQDEGLLDADEAATAIIQGAVEGNKDNSAGFGDADLGDALGSGIADYETESGDDVAVNVDTVIDDANNGTTGSAAEFNYGGGPTFAFPVNVAVNKLANITNSEAVDSWAISPSLPAGLAFSAATGEISGTPTTKTNAASYTVTATNAYGATDLVLTISVVDTTAPTTSGSLSLGTVAVCSGTLSWTAASDNYDAVGDITYYVKWSANQSDVDSPAGFGGAGGTLSAAVTGGLNNYSITTLPAVFPSNFYVNVKAVDTSGNAAYYTHLSTNAASCFPETAPTIGNSIINITSIDPGAMTVGISWSGATDTHTANTSLEYDVYVGEDAVMDTPAQVKLKTLKTGSPIIGVTGTGTHSFLVSPFTWGAQYYVNVVVKDGAGNEAIYFKQPFVFKPPIHLYALSTSMQGNFGNQDGACTAQMPVGLTSSYSGFAWTAKTFAATTAMPANNIVPGPEQQRPVKSGAGAMGQIAPNWTQLWSTGPTASLADAGVLTPAQAWWSGTDAGAATSNCLNWADNTSGQSGYNGNSSNVGVGPSGWTYSGTLFCNTTAKVLCVAY